MQVSFTPEFALRLCHELHLEEAILPGPYGGVNTYKLETALDADMLLCWVVSPNAYRVEGDGFSDEWGVKWKSIQYDTRFGKGHYTEMVGHPLDDDRAIETYQAPDPTRPDQYQITSRVLSACKAEYWIAGVAVSTIFERAWMLRGLEKLLMDFTLNPELAERILEIPYHYNLAVAKKLVEMGVDMIWIGDDVGSQQAMLISPDTWRKFLKPRMASFIAKLKPLNPPIRIAYHSDGTIYPIVPELIEIGVDILNPIQPACMNPEKLKQEFGDRLCFWGSIDIQQTLPFGTPEQVRNEVIKRLNTLGRHGGLILAPTHFVQLDTPMENFRTMIDTITGTPYRR
jgi:uroporphyrinogen decarboxylase